MAHHKRGKPKSRRAGCLYCKGHKHQGEAKVDRMTPNARRRLQPEEQERAARALVGAVPGPAWVKWAHEIDELED